MEQEQYSREQMIIIVLLCLLLHLVLLALIFFLQHQDLTEEKKLSVAYDKKMEQLLEKQIQEQLTPEEQKELFEWVSGQAKGNASVIFEQDPMDEQGEPDAKDDGHTLEKADHDASGADTGTQEKITGKKLELAEKQPTQTPEKQEEATSERKEELRDLAPEEFTTLAQVADLVSLAQDKKPQQKASTPLGDDEPAAEQATKRLTLADITKGLVQKMHNNSDHLVNALSDKTGKVSAEQIKYERYLKKLEWHIANSDRIHRRDYIDGLASAQTQPINNLKIYLSLERNGSIAEIQLLNSCGVKAIDDYFIFIFRDASTSFPSVPQSLPAPFRCCYLVGLQAEQTAPFRFTVS